MALTEFSGELDRPVLKEFSGDLDPVPPVKLKEFSGELDAPDMVKVASVIPPKPENPRGIFGAFVDTMGKVGDVITGRAGRRATLEHEAGAGVFGKNDSDWELQQRIDARSGLPQQPQSMTAGPANPQTFSTNLPLNMDSRPGEVVSAVGNVLKGGAQSAGALTRQSERGVRRFIADAQGAGENGVNPIADQYGADARFAGKAADNVLANLPKNQKWFAQQTAGAMQNIATALPAAVIPSAGPLAGAAKLTASMFVPQAGAAYTDLRDKGFGLDAATAGAVVQGASEAVPEAIGMSWLIGEAKKLPGFAASLVKGDIKAAEEIAKFYGKGQIAELLQEYPSTAGNFAGDYLMGDKTATRDRFINDMIETTKSVPIQGGIQSAAMHAVGKGQQAVSETYNNIRDRMDPQGSVARELESAVGDARAERAGDAEIVRLMQPPALRFDRSSPAPGAPMAPTLAQVSQSPAQEVRNESMTSEPPGSERISGGMPIATMQQGDGRNEGETDKEFAKRVIDKRESPQSLPEDHAAYFNLDGATQVPINQLFSTKTDEENTKGGDNGPKRMVAAANGELSKRDPITVMPSQTGAGFDVVDGNGTLTSVKKYGWQSLPVRVVSREQGVQMIEADKAKDAAKARAGMPIATMQQGGRNLRRHAGDLKGRTLAETLARIPEETRVVSPDPTRTLTGHDFASLDQNTPGEGFAPLRDKTPQQVDSELRAAMVQAVNESGLPPELAAKIKLPGAAVWDKAIRLPSGVRYWYERSAEGFARTYFALPGKLVERMIDMTAASSGNKKPYDNVKDGIAAMAQDAQGLPVTVGFRDPTSVTKALSDNEIDTHKFGNFSGTMQMVARTRDGKPLPTIDLQMAKMFGLKPEDVAADPRMYEALARYVMKIRDMQNRYLQPGQQPYESWQIQALGWVNQRDSADPDDYASAMPKIIAQLNDAGIPTPGGKITEETLRDSRTPAVLAPASRLAEGMTGTVETNTLLTPEGKRAADAYSSLSGRQEPWARKARAEHEAIQRRAMKAIGNKRPHPDGLKTKTQSIISNLYSLVTGNSLGSWDVRRIDFGGYGTFEGAVGPNVRIPMFLSPRGGTNVRIALTKPQAMSVLAVIGKAFDQAAMAASSFESVPLGKHDTFSIFIHRTDGSDIDSGLLGLIERAVGWPLNYQKVPNGWQIDINKFDPSTPPLDERTIHDAISPILTDHEVTLIPRAYDSVFIEASDYDGIIKGTENEILGRGNTRRGRASWGGTEQHRDFLAVAEALRATASSQAEALSAWAGGVESKSAGNRGLPLQALNQGGQPIRELAVGEVVPDSLLHQAAALLEAGPMVEKAAVSDAEIVRATLMTKKQRDMAESNKPAFDADLTRVAKELGGLPMLTSVKTEESAARKIRDEYNWDGAKIKDLLRGTILVSNEAGVGDAVRAVASQFEVVGRVKNNFIGKNPAGYADVNLVVRLPNGGLAEIQINTAAMFAAKSIGHQLYDVIRSGKATPQWEAKARALSKLIYASAREDGGLAQSISDSLMNSDSEISSPISSALAAGKGDKAPSLPSKSADPKSGDSRTASPSTSSGIQPSAINDFASISSTSVGSVSQLGMKSEPLNQAGASFAYAGMPVTNEAAGLSQQYVAKLSEQAMARRSLQPLEPEHRQVMDSAIADAVSTGRVPMAWAKGVTYYGLKPMAAGYANYNPADSTVGVKFNYLDEAAKGNEDVARDIRGWVSHELHHFIDNYRNSNDRMFYLSAESPRMDMRPGKDGRFDGQGDLANEAMSAYYGTEAPMELQQFLSYPMVQAESMARDGYADDAAAFAKVELFAQMGALYAATPDMMERYLPQWFGFFEEWNNARGDGSVERSRITLRNLLQKPVPNVRDSGGKRGEGIPAGSLAAGGGGSSVRPGGPRMGTNDPAGGVGRASPVLPATVTATGRQEALKALWGNVPPRRASVPANNHIPTHVNYSTFDDAKGLHTMYATMSRDFEKQIQQQRRGTVAIEQSYREARDLISDEAGISQEQIDKMLGRKAGTAAGAAEILARMAILESATAEVDRMANDLSGKGALQISEKDAIEFAAALDRAAMAHATFLGARAEIGRAMNAIRNFRGMPYDEAAVHNVLRTFSGKEGLAKVAEAIAGSSGLGGHGSTAVSGFRRGGSGGRAAAIGRLATAASKPTILDAAIEAWKAGLLSAPPTHLANILGNTVFTLMRVPTAAVAGMVGAISMQHDRARMGEVLAMMVGGLHGGAMGLRAAYNNILDEDATLGPTPTEERQHAIAGQTFGAKGKLGTMIDYIGKGVRTTFRALSAEDSFFKAVNMYMTLYAEATRTALMEGGKYWQGGFSRRVAELINEGSRHMLDPTGAMGPYPLSPKGRAIGDKAIQDGLKYTFQEKLGNIGSWIESGRHAVPALHFVIPFVRTPTNIFRITLEHTPFAPMSKQFREEIKAGGARMNTALSQVMVGSMLGAAAYMAAAAGLLTGGGDPEKEARKRRRELDIPDYAIKINGKWYEFRRMEPLGTLLGMAADAAEVSKYMTKEENEHVAMMISLAFSQAVLNKTYMRGLNDLLNVMTDPERYGATWEQSMAGTLVPSGVAFLGQEQDPWVRDAKVRGDMPAMEKFVTTVTNGIKARLPKTDLNPEFNRQSLPVAIDSWGQPRKQDEKAFTGAPMKATTESQDPVRQEAFRLRVKGADVGDKIQGVKVDSRQYETMSKTGGQLAHQILSGIVTAPGFSELKDAHKVMVYNEVLHEARQYGRDIITPELIDKIIAKQLKKGGIDERD